MATWNAEMTRCERPAPASRLRELLVMAAFSLVALAAAWAFVQHWPADRTESAQSETPAATTAATAPPQAQSARTSEQSPAPAAGAEAQALSEARDDLERTRDDLAAAVARIRELEGAVQELQAAPAPYRRAEPDALAISRAEPSAGSDAEPATQPAPADGNGTSNKEAPQVEGEEVVPNDGKEPQYAVQNGNTLEDRPRPLPPPRKPASLQPRRARSERTRYWPGPFRSRTAASRSREIAQPPTRHVDLNRDSAYCN